MLLSVDPDPNGCTGRGHARSLPIGSGGKVARIGAYPTYRPVQSAGRVVGFLVVAVALVCVVVLGVGELATSSDPTRFACLVGAAIGAGVAFIGGDGFWWCRTLRYELGPTAPEIRAGTHLNRVR